MEIALTVALISAAVALFAQLATHRLAGLREQQARRAAACAAYRAALLEALRGLYPEPLDWPAEAPDIVSVLESRFAPMQAAGAAFRPYLSWFARWQFDRAWNIFRHGRGRRSSGRHNFWQYVPGPPGAAPQAWPGTGTPLQQAQGAFRKNVDRILRFANVI